MSYIYSHDDVLELDPEVARQRFGGKCLGLLSIPLAWRPPAVFISCDLYEKWKANKATFAAWCANHLSAEISEAITKIGSYAIIRSSASDETISERGQFLSRRIDLTSGAQKFAQAINEIFACYDSRNGAMCLVLQQFCPANATGFLSNEMRLADKPYRWVAERRNVGPDYEAHHQYSLSAKQAKLFPKDEPLICMSDAELLARLRSVALEFWKTSSQRTLLEWCWDGNRLWLLQRDIALPPPGGRVPSLLVEVNQTPPSASNGNLFRRFAVGTKSPWGKLRNVNDFVIDGAVPPHRLFYATAQQVEHALLSDHDVKNEIEALTGGRCVIRTDALEIRFNRKRTNTVSASAAINWMKEEIQSWKLNGTELRDIAFILHAYIPAAAAAWSYYSRKSNHVRVDGLWGLADGMQFYPCDTYICDTQTGNEISATQRFKNLALLEQSNGAWATERIDERYARHRALSKAVTRDIAVKTRKIAEAIADDVQIMWFVGIPKELDLGSNLPWYKVIPKVMRRDRYAPSLACRLM